MGKYVKRVNLADPKEAKKIIDSRCLITTSIQKQLKELGFELFFRGFNSHSGDCYLYAQDGKYYLSFGMSNINNAGRGYEIQVKPKRLKWLK